MLYHLLYPLHEQITLFNVIRYLSFRSLAAAMTALVISFIFGPMLIRWLQQEQIGQTIRMTARAGTPEANPTMGALIIAGTLSTAQVDSTACMRVVVDHAGTSRGIVDDWRKLRRTARGLGKLVFWRFPLAAIVARSCTRYSRLPVQPTLTPLFKGVQPDLVG
jgi:phospho-N-acetylmuramoyl-pentapeptide-transferase